MTAGVTQEPDRTTAYAGGTDETAAPCPVCGAYSGTTLAQSSALLAVCDVLVVRALESVGKRIVRADRSRFKRLGSRPWHYAHTIWTPDQVMTDKGLAGSWDVIPAMLTNHGSCGATVAQVQTMIDQYVRDLLITGTPHRLEELRYRFERLLGVVPEPSDPFVPEVAGR